MRQSQLRRFNNYPAVVCLIDEVRGQNNEAQSSRSKTSKVEFCGQSVGPSRLVIGFTRYAQSCLYFIRLSVLVMVAEPPEEQVVSSLLPVEAVPKMLVIIIIIIIRITVQ